jgi:hypothetical protein
LGFGVEDWKIGRVEEWKGGRVEEWKVEEWKVGDDSGEFVAKNVEAVRN